MHLPDLTPHARRGGTGAAVLVVAVVALLAALASVRWVRARRAAPVAPGRASAAAPATTGSEEPRGLAQESLREPAASEPTPTVRDALRAFWGERAEEVLAGLEKRGVDLDASAQRLRPWTEARERLMATALVPDEELRERARRYDGWPDELDQDFVDRLFGGPAPKVGAPEMAVLNALVKPLTDDVRLAYEAREQERQQAVRNKILSDDIARSPFYMPEGVHSGGGLESFSMSTCGWSISLGLTRDEVPGWTEWKRVAEEKSQERHKVLRDYLKSLP